MDSQRCCGADNLAGRRLNMSARTPHADEGAYARAWLAKREHLNHDFLSNRIRGALRACRSASGLHRVSAREAARILTERSGDISDLLFMARSGLDPAPFVSVVLRHRLSDHSREWLSERTASRWGRSRAVSGLITSASARLATALVCASALLTDSLFRQEDLLAFERSVEELSRAISAFPHSFSDAVLLIAGE